MNPHEPASPPSDAAFPAQEGPIAAAWLGFAKLIPADAPPAQHVEMRHSFFAGAPACLLAMLDSTAKDSEAEGTDHIALIDQELRAYAQSLGAPGSSPGGLLQ